LGTTLNASTPVTTAGSDTYQYSDDQQDEVDSGVRGHNVDLDLYDDLITEEGQEKSASINEVCVFTKLLLKFLMYYFLKLFAQGTSPLFCTLSQAV